MRSLLAYSKGVTEEEKITLRIKADNSGDVYVPTAGFSTDGKQDCEYDWMVSVDGNTAVEYSGINGFNGNKIRVGYGLNPGSVHTVIITPKVENYGWLRAFGYMGTDIASSLINIISDKSYKGFAMSDEFTGDYFKAYQYYGCINLINTDEELLPDTLLIIGDKYRYYEYAGCTSLVSNADEKILKTVRIIGDDYRAYQYQNCTNINIINMRAINWASVGNNYRLNQFDGMGNDREPMDVYIEGGIEEGGSWGLDNDRVKNIYVYEGLVNDYQTKLSGITSSKIKKNADWDNFEYEFIEYIALADSNGVIRVPVAGISTTNGQNCAYDWYISIDGGTAVQYTGTGSTTYLSVGSGLIGGSEHRVVIKPTTVSWGWGRAFGFFGSGAEGYIKEIIHDSYKCYAISRTSTGDYYKADTYTACTNLINSYEKLPTSVTTIGNNYMANCYAGCTGLKTAFWEILHKGISIGSNYRSMEYTGCSAMEIHKGIAGYSGTYPTNYKYQYLSGAGNGLKVYITRYEGQTPTPALGLANGNVDKVYCFVNDIYNYLYNTYRTSSSAITDKDKFKPRYYNYIVYEHPDINRYSSAGTASVTSNWNGHRVSGLSAVGMGGYIGIANGTGDKSSYQWVETYFYNLATRWDIRTAPALFNDYIRGGGSDWNTSIFGFYAIGCRLYIFWREKHNPYVKQYEYDGEKYVYKGQASFPTSSIDSGYAYPRDGFGISNNGQYIYYTSEDDNGSATYYRWLYEMTTPRDITTATFVKQFANGAYLFNNKQIRFSDDGYMMYTAEGKQYSLSRPFQIDTATDTGKTISGLTYINFSRDAQWLYGGVNKQYKAS